MPQRDAAIVNPTASQTLGFLLIDDFALMSYVALVEAFRAANTLSGKMLYKWRHYSIAGSPARASNGVEIMVDGIPDAKTEPCDILFVCAGGNPSAFANRDTFAQLRAAAARGTTIAGVSGGPYILARAGLLAGRRCTVHWEHEPAFREAFPQLVVEGGLYVIDGPSITCAGGTAGLDLAVELIRRHHGPAIAAGVGEWFIRTQPREGSGAQRPALAARYHVAHPGVVAALAAMETHIAEPLGRSELAARAGVSVRQLERLFARHIGQTIGQHYLALRLDAAKRLLRETGLSRLDVAVACGFADVSHFSRSFRRRFGQSPVRARASG